MMLAVDATQGDTLALALFSSSDARALPPLFFESLPCVPDAVPEHVQDFLERAQVLPARIIMCGFVSGPGSASMLRAGASMLCAFALARRIPVVALVRTGEVWTASSAPLPFVLPVYAAPARVTPSKRDALKRLIV